LFFFNISIHDQFNKFKNSRKFALKAANILCLRKYSNPQPCKYREFVDFFPLSLDFYLQFCDHHFGFAFFSQFNELLLLYIIIYDYFYFSFSAIDVPTRHYAFQDCSPSHPSFYLPTSLSHFLSLLSSLSSLSLSHLLTLSHSLSTSLSTSLSLSHSITLFLFLSSILPSLPQHSFNFCLSCVSEIRREGVNAEDIEK